jgi:hypothetical protein
MSASNHNHTPTKMGASARIPKGQRKHLRKAKARIAGEVADTDERRRRLDAICLQLGLQDRKALEKARKKRSKRRAARARARAKKLASSA